MKIIQITIFNELFYLSNINWNRCEEYSLKNIVYEVCRCWNNKNEYSTITDIANTFKIGRNTTREYIKKGVKLGWCNYDPVKEKSKVSKRNGKLGTKPILMYNKEMDLIGEFESASWLDKHSEELLGIKLIGGKVSSVCRGERKTHKGYIFRFKETC